MITIREYLQFKVHKISAEIFRLKQTASKECGYISPKYREWDRYKALKKECSLWLTMLSIVKWWNDFIPTKKEAIKLFQTRNFANHARKGYKAKNLYYKAFRRLQKIGNRLERESQKDKEGIALWQEEKATSKKEVVHAV